tara:strand:+ start:1351 stop:2550 length:1200 start_codon:yes stop_codon:yes gene_type:complete
MSNLLNEAIVDAKALRDAALKNAETAIINKYSEQVRTAMTQLLEQDDMELDMGADPGGDLGGEMGGDLGADPMALDPGASGGEEEEGEAVAEDIPLAATDNLSENDGENLSRLARGGEDVEVEINLDALQEAVEALQNEQEIDIDEETLAEIMALDEQSQEGADDLYNVDETGTDDDDDEENSAQALAGSAAAETADSTTMKRAGLEEEVEISDEFIDEIVERLTVDMGATLSGWAGRSSESQKYEMEREMAHRRSTDVQDDLETLKKAYEELIFENKQLAESLKKYKQATNELREGLHDVNLSNARLLYTNRVLRNTSLNERQKTKIADAISKAGSVTEAKTIYQTLESATPAATKRSPQSLSEAIGRRGTSVIRASRKESTPSDPLAERMKRLAGIK